MDLTNFILHILLEVILSQQPGYVYIKDSQLFSSDGLVRNYHISALQANFLPCGYYLKHAEQVAPFSN